MRSRYFDGFGSAGPNLRCFRPLWRWAIERLLFRKEGYAVDLDSPRVALLYGDGCRRACEKQRRGVFSGALVKLFRHLRLRVMRADCGFCVAEWLAFREELCVPFTVVAKLAEPVQGLVRGNLMWYATELAGPDMARWIIKPSAGSGPATDPHPPSAGAPVRGWRQKS
jgi:hypothetical protein